MRSVLASFLLSGLLVPVLHGTPALAQPEHTIQRLLEGGWEIAGYAGTFDNRSTVILFRHKDRTFLVQCSTLHDVTRTPRLVTNCYELR